MSHAIVAPSSLDRTVQCPASLGLEALYPETEQGPDAAEGEASHWAGAELLSGRLPMEGDVAPNGVRLSVEMLEGADLYYNDVFRALQPYQRHTTSGAIEVAVDIHSISPLCWGTPDYRNWVNPGRLRLMLWDYKFGYRVVEAFENYQLIAYALGAVAQMGIDAALVDVEMRIVQPRAHHREGPVRIWSCAATDLEPYRAIAAAKVEEALGPAPMAHVGPGCHDCRARHACPTLQGAGYDACDVAGGSQPLELTPLALGIELRTLKRAQSLLDARVSGLEEQVTAANRRGVNVPHWKIEHGEGRKVWNVPAAQVIQTGELLGGLALAKRVDAITPLQALKAGLPPALVDAMSRRIPGGATLVPDDGSTARRVFGVNRNVG